MEKKEKEKKGKGNERRSRNNRNRGKLRYTRCLVNIIGIHAPTPIIVTELQLHNCSHSMQRTWFYLATRLKRFLLIPKYKPILDHVFDIFIEKKKKKQLDTNIFNFDFLVVIFIFLASRFNFISRGKITYRSWSV